MIAVVTAVAAVLVSAACLVATWIAVRAATRARAQLAAMRAELVTVLEQIAVANATEDRLREQVSEQMLRRTADFEAFRAQVQELRESYERVFRAYQIAHGLDGPLLSRRVQ